MEAFQLISHFCCVCVCVLTTSLLPLTLASPPGFNDLIADPSPHSEKSMPVELSAAVYIVAMATTPFWLSLMC